MLSSLSPLPNGVMVYQYHDAKVLYIHVYRE